MYSKDDSKLLLFTMPNCHVCEETKRKLKEKKLIYREIKVMDNKENQELAIKYNVKMAGTVINEETGEKIDINNTEWIKALNNAANHIK